MNIEQRNQQMLQSFLIGFSQEMDHTIITILFNLLIPDNKEADHIITSCMENYIKNAEPFLSHLSKESIGLGGMFKEKLVNFVFTQLKDDESKKEFAQKYGISISNLIKVSEVDGKYSN